MSDPSETTSGSPVLATIVGCFGLMLFPAILLAFVGYAGFMYYESKNAPSAPPGGGASTQAPAVPLSPQEEQSIRSLLTSLGSLDNQTRQASWKGILALSQRNTAGVRQRLAEELGRSTNGNFIRTAVGGLCTHFQEPGRLAAVQAAVNRRDDRAALSAFVEGAKEIPEAALRAEMLRRFRKALSDARSHHLDLFDSF